MTTIHDRIELIIKELKCSEREFSVKLKHANCWANKLINRKSALSHFDILKMREQFKVNPMYLLDGQKPEFLK